MKKAALRLLFILQKKAKGPFPARGCSPLRALACGGRSHTCGPSSVFCQVHAPAKDGFEFLRACGRELCEASLPAV